MSSESGADYLRRLKQDEMRLVAQPAVTASSDEHLPTPNDAETRAKSVKEAQNSGLMAPMFGLGKLSPTAVSAAATSSSPLPILWGRE